MVGKKNYIRKWSSGLFWAVRAAERKKLPTAISKQRFEVVCCKVAVNQVRWSKLDREEGCLLSVIFKITAYLSPGKDRLRVPIDCWALWKYIKSLSQAYTWYNWFLCSPIFGRIREDVSPLSLSMKILSINSFTTKLLSSLLRSLTVKLFIDNMFIERQGFKNITRKGWCSWIKNRLTTYSEISL